jgi:prepilin-type N-terminal cleavage/methylation domain-containing protein
LRSGRTNPRTAFTIVEVIVVVVILVILAAAVGPRLAAMGGREVRASAMEVGELVSVAARRDALTSQRVAIEFEGDKGRLVLMTVDAAPAGGGAVAQWREDRLIPPVMLGKTKIADALMDGVSLDARGWRVEFPQGGRRPALELILSDAKGKEHWRVELPSSAAQAAIAPGNALGMSDQAIDLDASGGGTSPW